MDIFHLAWRYLRVYPGHSFTGALVVRIDGEMLARCRHLIIFLYAMHHGYAKLGDQVRVFSVDFLISAPSLVTPDIENRSIYVRIAEQSRFTTCNVSHLFNQASVPCMPHTQLGREVGRLIGFDTADTFVGKIYRDTQTGFFDEKFLNLIQGPCMT